MAYKYLSISFLGTYSNMIKFFDTKGWTYEIKNVGHNKLLLKVSEELTEEIQFFKNSVLDEVSQEKILAVNIISEDEYIKTSENGFEIIEKQTENTSKEVIKPAEDVRASSFVDPMVNIAREINPFKKNEEEVKPVGVPEDLKTRIAFALADTSLPSKSPLPSEDSFTYLTSRNYLSYFGVVSSVLIFAMTLFDV